MKCPPLIEFVLLVENIVLHAHQTSCTGQIKDFVICWLKLEMLCHERHVALHGPSEGFFHRCVQSHSHLHHMSCIQQRKKSLYHSSREKKAGVAIHNEWSAATSLLAWEGGVDASEQTDIFQFPFCTSLPLSSEANDDPQAQDYTNMLFDGPKIHWCWSR